MTKVPAPLFFLGYKSDFIKLDIENMERKSNEAYKHDLKEVRRVQFWCFFIAAFIAWYLTWGIK